MRYLFILVFIGGCTSTTGSFRPEIDMTTFQADCRWASYQMSQLESELARYQTTRADQPDYYQQLKNNIWAIRSTCRAYRS
jgi:hypothetical protein